MKTICFIAALITIGKFLLSKKKYFKWLIKPSVIDTILIAGSAIASFVYCILGVMYALIAYDKYDYKVALFVSGIMFLAALNFFYQNIKLTQ